MSDQLAIVLLAVLIGVLVVVRWWTYAIWIPPSDTSPICNCRRQDTNVPWSGHELWCDIGYESAAIGDTGKTR